MIPTLYTILFTGHTLGIQGYGRGIGNQNYTSLTITAATGFSFCLKGNVQLCISD